MTRDQYGLADAVLILRDLACLVRASPHFIVREGNQLIAKELALIATAAAREGGLSDYEVAGPRPCSQSEWIGALAGALFSQKEGEALLKKLRAATDGG